MCAKCPCHDREQARINRMIKQELLGFKLSFSCFLLVDMQALACKVLPLSDVLQIRLPRKADLNLSRGQGFTRITSDAVFNGLLCLPPSWLFYAPTPKEASVSGTDAWTAE